MCFKNRKVGLQVTAEVRIMPVTYTWKILLWVLNIFLTDLPATGNKDPASASTFLASFEQLGEAYKNPFLPAQTESIKIPVGEG